MYQSLSPARFESLIREYLHGSHLLPLDLGGRLQPQGEAAMKRAAAEGSKARRHLQKKTTVAGRQLTLRRPGNDS